MPDIDGLYSSDVEVCRIPMQSCFGALSNQLFDDAEPIFGHP
jgi:hypothetical protein